MRTSWSGRTNVEKILLKKVPNEIWLESFLKCGRALIKKLKKKQTKKYLRDKNETWMFCAEWIWSLVKARVNRQFNETIKSVNRWFTFLRFAWNFVGIHWVLIVEWDFFVFYFVFVSSTMRATQKIHYQLIDLYRVLSVIGSIKLAESFTLSTREEAKKNSAGWFYFVEVRN